MPAALPERPDHDPELTRRYRTAEHRLRAQHARAEADLSLGEYDFPAFVERREQARLEERLAAAMESGLTGPDPAE